MPTDAPAGDGSVPAVDQPQTDPHEDLVFAAHDVRRDRPQRSDYTHENLGFAPATRTGRPEDDFLITEPPGTALRAPLDALVVGTPPVAAPPDEPPPARPNSFHVTSGEAPAAQSSELPWTVRPIRRPAATYRGWTSRHSDLMERAATDTMQRLREEAVHVSWKAASIAITSADARLYRKRDW